MRKTFKQPFHYFCSYHAQPPQTDILSARCQKFYRQSTTLFIPKSQATSTKDKCQIIYAVRYHKQDCSKGEHLSVLESSRPYSGTVFITVHLNQISNRKHVETQATSKVPDLLQTYPTNSQHL